MCYITIDYLFAHKKFGLISTVESESKLSSEFWAGGTEFMAGEQCRRLLLK